MPRSVGELRTQDVLVGNGAFPQTWRRPKGQIRQRRGDDGESTERRPHVRQSPRTAVHRIQGTDEQRPHLLRKFAELLRQQPRSGFVRYERTRVQPDVARYRRLRTFVLRSRTQYDDRDAERALRLRLCLVLQGSVQRVRQRNRRPYL